MGQQKSKICRNAYHHRFHSNSAKILPRSQCKFKNLEKFFILICDQAKIEELEEHKIETWREVLKEYRRPFIYLRPDDSLYDAVKILTQNRVHRLPIIDPHTGNVTCIVTHKRILRYLYLFVR